MRELQLRLVVDDGPARLAADGVIGAIEANPKLTLCLPTGRTVRPVLQHLVDAYDQGRISFAEVRLCNVDEYVGLASDHPASFAHFLHTNFIDHVDVDPKRICLFDGVAPDLYAEMRRYCQWIEDVGGVDLGLFGIGRNGHIGFNEPGSDERQTVHLVDLADETLAANHADLPIVPPTQAITIGLDAILDMREVLMIGTGEPKAAAIRALFEDGSVSDCPARVLRHHRKATVLVDPQAAQGVMADVGGRAIIYG